MEEKLRNIHVRATGCKVQQNWLHLVHTEEKKEAECRKRGKHRMSLELCLALRLTLNPRSSDWSWFLCFKTSKPARSADEFPAEVIARLLICFVGLMFSDIFDPP